MIATVQSTLYSAILFFLKIIEIERSPSLSHCQPFVIGFKYIERLDSHLPHLHARAGYDAPSVALVLVYRKATITQWHNVGRMIECEKETVDIEQTGWGGSPAARGTCG